MRQTDPGREQALLADLGEHRLAPITAITVHIVPDRARWRLRIRVSSPHRAITRDVGGLAVVEEAVAYAEHLLEELIRLSPLQRTRWLLLLAAQQDVDPLALLVPVRTGRCPPEAAVAETTR